MKFERLDRPDFGYLRVRFDGGGEQITAESGAMVSMSSTLQMKTQARGGILAAAKRSVLGGESFFQNTFTSTAAGEELMLLERCVSNANVAFSDFSVAVCKAAGAALVSLTLLGRLAVRSSSAVGRHRIFLATRRPPRAANSDQRRR